jgi:prepilin-type N-terminal cleavage/methylation domain-containing protein
MKRRFQNSARGFTLIEILVVIGIISILAAIALLQYDSYRKRGYISAIKSDLRNAGAAEDAYFVKHKVFTAPLANLDLSQSANVSLSIAVAGGGTSYTISGTNTNCGADTWTYTGSGAITEPPTPCN